MTPKANTEETEDIGVLRLDKSTLVPIGLLVAVVLASISATVWINTYLLQITHSIQQVETRVTALSIQLNSLTQGTWTLSDMRAWVAVLSAKNAALLVPNPEPVR